MEPYPKSARLAILAAASTGISEDLLPEILKRLPVESLCRFRCVCKSWNSLITSSFLVNLHHSVSSSSTTPPHLKSYLRIPYFRLLFEYRYYDSYALYSPNLNSSISEYQHIRHDVHFPFEFGEVTCSNFPSKDSKLYFTFVDVVHGVVCLSATLDSSFDHTILWNPAIHKYLPLPHRPLLWQLEAAIAGFAREGIAQTVRFECHALGFGYDTSKNDFKVVRLWIPHSDMFSGLHSLQPIYEVYSTREGLWRVAAITHIGEPCFLGGIMSRTGCFVNGTIHWLVTNNDHSTVSVLMFECESEEFTKVELSGQVFPLYSDVPLLSNRVELVKYAGMLCALVRPLWLHLHNQHIDMWAMEEHGLASSWKKLFRIRPSEYNLIVYEPSLDKLAPYGPAQWADFYLRPEFRFEQVLSDRLYEESMFLMDDTKAKSYTECETVFIQS